MNWVVRELAGADLGDGRLDNRLIRIVTDLSERPNATVPVSSGDWAQTKAAYRFWDNDKVTSQGILQAHVEQTVRRAGASAVVLVAQDTSEIDLTTHRKTSGLGYLASSKRRGLLVHSLLAMSPAGVPLGLLGQESWTRPLEQLGKAAQRHGRPIEEKESRRWLDGLAVVERTLAAHPKVVVIADREADVFELFAAPRSHNVELLVRVRHERRAVDHPAGRLLPALKEAPVAGRLAVNVPRRDDRPARTAQLTVRFARLTVLPPARLRGQHAPQQVNFILAEEAEPPAGVAAVRWILATTLSIDSLEDAAQAIGWYVLRWRIERFHYVLKSGCGMEKLELETVARLQRALATFSLVAWRLLWLTYAARENPDASCEIVWSAPHWQLLYCLVHKNASLPETTPTLQQTVRWVAQLGGFLGRRHDGQPGVKTLWRGMQRLHDVLDALPLLLPRLAEPTKQHATYG